MGKVVKLALAAAAGFAAGVLLAPKSGEETRKELKAKANKLSKKAKSHYAKAHSTAKGSASVVSEEAKAFMGSAKQSVQRVGKDVSKEAEKLTKEAKTRVNRVADSTKPPKK